MSIDVTVSRNSGKKLGGIATLVLSTALAVTGMPNESYAAGRAAERAPKLYVNTSPSHYSMQGKSRAEAERDLYELTKTAELEEGFLFIKYKDGSTMVQEIGEDETSELHKMKFEKNKQFKDADKIAEVTFYHQHPDKPARVTYHGETPSTIDLENGSYALRWVNHFFPQVNADFRIVVSTGTYVLKLNPGQEQNREAIRDATGKETWLGGMRVGLGIVDTGFDYGKWNRKNFVSQNKKLAAKLCNTHYNVTFQARGDQSAPTFVDYRSQTHAMRKKAAGLEQRLKKMRQTVDQMKQKTHQRQRK